MRLADDSTCGWVATLPAPAAVVRLVGERRADCAVVGAGFTGLAVARRLAQHQPAWRIAVLEAQRVGLGASGRNSGFLVDVAHYRPGLGVEGNRRIVRLARYGIDSLRAAVTEHRIDCAWSELGRLHGAATESGVEEQDLLADKLDAMGEPYRRLDRAGVAAITGSEFYYGAIQTPGSVLVQPAALVRGLAASLPAGVALYEESPVRSIERGAEHRVVTERGAVAAPRVVLCANGYTPALGFLRRRVFPMLTFGSLTRVLSEAEQRSLGGQREWGVVAEQRMGPTVRRTRDQRLLVRCGVRYAPRRSEALHAAIERLHADALRARFPSLPIELEHTWGGVLGMTLNGATQFGPLGGGIWSAAGYNGVGVALGTTLGSLLADLIVGADSPALADARAMPAPSWIPPDPFLGIGVRATLAAMRARAGDEAC